MMDDDRLPNMADFRLLQSTDAEGAVALRRLALTTDGYAFAERFDSDPALNVDFVRERLADSGFAAGAVVIGAFDPGLVGMVGLSQDSQEPSGAWLWGFYVSPEYRRRGCGRSLLEHALTCATEMTGVRRVQLSVSHRAVAAIRLYESAGFMTVDTLPDKRRMELLMTSER